MPAQAAVYAVPLMPSITLRHCHRFPAFTSITGKQIPRARPASRCTQPLKGSSRALTLVASASAQTVPLEKLLEVAERAAKAGAAVSDRLLAPTVCKLFDILPVCS